MRGSGVGRGGRRDLGEHRCSAVRAPPAERRKQSSVLSFVIQSGGKRRQRDFVPIPDVAMVVVEFLVTDRESKIANSLGDRPATRHRDYIHRDDRNRDTEGAGAPARHGASRSAPPDRRKANARRRPRAARRSLDRRADRGRMPSHRAASTPQCKRAFPSSYTRPHCACACVQRPQRRRHRLNSYASSVRWTVANAGMWA